MKKYRCIVCEWVYDPDKGDASGGVKPGTDFDDIYSEWVCPVCGEGKEMFDPIEE